MQQRRIDTESALQRLNSYAPTAPQKAAAIAFLRSEAEAFLTHRKSKCFLLIPVEEAVVKAGENRVVFREPTQKHHIVFEPDGSKTKGLARPGSLAVSAIRAWLCGTQQARALGLSAGVAAPAPPAGAVAAQITVPAHLCDLRSPLPTHRPPLHPPTTRKPQNTLLRCCTPTMHTHNSALAPAPALVPATRSGPLPPAATASAPRAPAAAATMERPHAAAAEAWGCATARGAGA